MTHAYDLARRSADIHWPDGYVPEDAHLFAHNEIVIDRPAATIWRYLVGAGSWPGWYPNAQNVAVTSPDGMLAEGVTFTWSTFGLAITSTVAEWYRGSGSAGTGRAWCRGRM